MSARPERQAFDDAELREHAQRAGERGWTVFPCVPGGKRPARKRWQHLASSDPVEIDAMWTGTGYNIGVACGTSGLLVIDVDLHDPAALPASQGPAQRLQAVAGEHQLAATYTVRTPSGGLHVYFRAPVRSRLRNTAGRLAPQIDTRANGGYVLAAGSRTTQGTYVALDPSVPVADAPAWLLALLEDRGTRAAIPEQRLPDGQPASPVATDTAGSLWRYLDAAVAGEIGRVHRAQPGQRNHSLFLAAANLGELIAGGALSRTPTVLALLRAAQAHVDVGAYDPSQARRTIASGLAAGARNPRHVASVPQPGRPARDGQDSPALEESHRARSNP